MKRRNSVAIAAVLVALLALAAAIYFLRPGPSPLPSTAQAPEAGESPAPSATTPPAEVTPPAEEEKAADTPKPAEEKAADAPAPAEKAEETPAPAEQTAEDEPAAPAEEKTADAATPEPEAGEQPSFDVVRIEPTGEGVIAGRAAPGWKVIIESRGEMVAEATADDQGEWTVVFDRPLPPGSHDLSLKATSPDGAQEYSSKQSVSADVTAAATQSASLPEQAPSPAESATRPAGKAGLSGTTPSQVVKPVETAVPPAPKPSGPETITAERDVTPGRVATDEASPLPQTASIEEGRAAPPTALPPQLKPGTYTILPGDTLWDIATRYLGAGWRYKQIYRDNRKIIRNPNLIYPEQNMTIAEPPSETN